MGILGSEMGCILAMVPWDPALTRGGCFSPPGNHILRVPVGKRKEGDFKVRNLGSGLWQKESPGSQAAAPGWGTAEAGVIGHSPLVSLAPSLPCERERQHKKPTVLMAV